MNFIALIPIVIKYLPLIISFVETEGPGMQEFGKEVHDAIIAAKNADGTYNWAKLLPIIFKYAPSAFTFIQKQGLSFQTVISDVMGALKAPTGTVAPVVPVLSGPGFVFPVQVAQSVGTMGFKS